MIARWLVYVDGKYRSYTQPATTRMHLTLTPGSHALSVVAAYTDGTRSPAVTIHGAPP